MTGSYWSSGAPWWSSWTVVHGNRVRHLQWITSQPKLIDWSFPTLQEFELVNINGRIFLSIYSSVPYAGDTCFSCCSIILSNRSPPSVMGDERAVFHFQNLTPANECNFFSNFALPCFIRFISIWNVNSYLLGRKRQAEPPHSVSHPDLSLLNISLT